MNFKQLFENIICEEEGKITDICGYKFYLKMGKEGEIPHIHYIGETFGCISIEYASYYNHENGMTPLTPSAEKEFVRIMNKDDTLWLRMVKMWNTLFPDNKVRVNENPYKTTKHIMIKTPPSRPITKSV